MRATKDGVFFDGCYGSNAVPPAGKISFIDETLLEVHLHPGILAMLIAICAHTFKLESPALDKLIRRLESFGQDQSERDRTDKLYNSWQVTNQLEKLSLLKSLLFNPETDRKTVKYFHDICKHRLESFPKRKVKKKDG